MAKFVEDLTVFFSGEFSETVSVGGQSVVGIFDAPYLAIEEIEGSAPEFSAPTDSLPAGVEDGTPLVRTTTGISYKVINVRPSGNGVTVLKLHETTP